MDDIKNQLINEEHRLAEAQKNKDEKILLELVSAGFEGVDPHGRRINRDSFIQAYTSQEFTIKSLDIDDMSMRIYGDIGIFIGKSTFKGAFKDRPIEGTAEFTDVWYYNEKKWQLIGFQVTPIERFE